MVLNYYNGSIHFLFTRKAMYKAFYRISLFNYIQDYIDINGIENDKLSVQNVY